jgi:hypothetical protein
MLQVFKLVVECMTSPFWLSTPSRLAFLRHGRHGHRSLTTVTSPSPLAPSSTFTATLPRALALMHLDARPRLRRRAPLHWCSCPAFHHSADKLLQGQARAIATPWAAVLHNLARMTSQGRAIVGYAPAYLYLPSPSRAPPRTRLYPILSATPTNTTRPCFPPSAPL